MKPRWLPDSLGKSVLELTHTAIDADSRRTSSAGLPEGDGWREFRSELLGTVGKVENSEVLPLLSGAIHRPDLPLDDLQKTALSVASLGDKNSLPVLKEALQIHQNRGYRYQYMILYAFGALETPLAAAEIEKIAQYCTPDLMGRMGWVIRDNQTLKNSAEWAGFLQNFVLKNSRFSEEVKARVLQTIEEVKTKQVKILLESIIKESGSERLRDASKKILEKNFAG